MKSLSIAEVQQIIGMSDQSIHCSEFNSERFTQFIGIWKQRAEEAVNYHKRNDLAMQADQVIAFAESSGQEFLRLYTCTSEKTGRVSFLYNINSRDFLQVGERKEISQSEQAAPRNR